MLFFNKRIAPVSARLMTWEVTTAFDGTLTETELYKRFDDEFQGVLGVDSASGVCMRFWHLISFNASNGRRHRYLVVVANEPLARYRSKFDRCLPRQVALFAIADKILRGELNVESFIDSAENGCVVKTANDEYADAASDGNLLLVALWNKTLSVLVFANGQLCHWSEEHGYGDSFDELCKSRVSRFKAFLKNDELFNNEAAEGNFHCCEVFLNCNNVINMNEFFCMGVHDPFWNHLDLDACASMKSCEKRRWILFAMTILVLVLSLVLLLKFPLGWKIENDESINDVAAVDLDLPSSDALNRLTWAKGHRDMVRHERRWTRSSCDLPEWTLLGIVGGRAALIQLASGETKTLMLDDMLYSSRVKSIGKDDVVLRCGGKDFLYKIGSKNDGSRKPVSKKFGSKFGSR